MMHSSHKRNRKTGLVAAGIGAAVLAAAWSWAYAAHEHGQDGDKGKQEDKAGGGGHEEHGGKGKKMGHMMQHGEPGGVEQACHDAGKHPPHYCEPMYKAVSSVPGVRIADVDPAGERELVVKLGELNVQAPGVTQKLVIVAGGGDLAGAAVVEAGWKKEKSVSLKLNGTGSIYVHRHVHLHLFPLSAP